jgi:hypothetical protein
MERDQDCATTDPHGDATPEALIIVTRIAARRRGRTFDH